MKRRVVVTGLGIISPLGNGVKYNWEALLSSKSGISKISSFKADDLPCKIAGQVPFSSEHPAPFLIDSYIDLKDQRKMGLFIAYAIAASEQAVNDSGYKAQTEHEQKRSGVIIGSGIGGLSNIYETSLILKERGARRVSPFFIPATLINLSSGHVSIKHNFKGPNHSVVTACATGTHAIGEAFRIIQYGDADIMIAGGTEAAVCRIGVAGFSAARALSTAYNDNPTKASRPWDINRDGFVMGEGAGILIIEEYEHAKKRCANIYAEIIGYGLSGDAHHITAPSENGDGAHLAMQNAILNASLNVEDIDYINAHGTSTQLGDLTEVKAIKALFKQHAYKLGISSNKSSIGHLLGAAGSVEAIFSILALKDNIMPPTLNLDEPSPECDLNFVPHTPQAKKINTLISNSFGFGGTNACIVFKKI
ncbi:MAG: beta-ketoacyl-ACP synthase II [Alphaproteobacteria bacterium]